MLPLLHFNLACIYSLTEEKEKSIEHLSKAIDLGWEPNPLAWVNGTLCDYLLNPIRETKEFKQLIKKHFPEFYDLATSLPKIE